jgi:hypothetical protein
MLARVDPIAERSQGRFVSDQCHALRDRDRGSPASRLC